MNINENVLKAVFQNRVVAVVGLSKDSSKDSYHVAEYLQTQGYKIVPINPTADQILDEKCYKSLLEVPEEVQRQIEIVDIFRPPQDVPPIVDQAIQLKKRFGTLKAVWMQLGIIHEEAAKKAEEAGLTVVMNRCMMIEHKRLISQSDKELERIRAEKRQELAGMVMKKKVGKPITVTDETFDEVVRQNPKMVVDFWASWCGPCQIMSPIIDELAEEYAGKITFGKLNVDENPLISERYGVMSIPTLLVMKNGEEVDRIVGAMPKERVKEKLQELFST
ncbi:MAG: thioredoxin [Candidatus Bathyarchaeia archaeon]